MFALLQRTTTPDGASSGGIPTRRSVEATLTEALDLITARYSLLNAADDRRATYCRVYARYVAALRREIAADAFGSAAGWLADLELDSARRYLHAIDAWSCHNMWSVPAPWRGAFALTADASGDAIATALRAHLSYELPLAIARAGIVRGASVAFKHAGRLFGAAAPPHARDIGVLHAAAWRDGSALAVASDRERDVAYRRLQMDAMRAIVHGR